MASIGTFTFFVVSAWVEHQGAVHDWDLPIEANSPDEAIEKVRKGISTGILGVGMYAEHIIYVCEIFKLIKILSVERVIVNVRAE